MFLLNQQFNIIQFKNFI